MARPLVAKKQGDDLDSIFYMNNEVQVEVEQASLKGSKTLIAKTIKSRRYYGTRARVRVGALAA